MAVRTGSGTLLTGCTAAQGSRIKEEDNLDSAEVFSGSHAFMGTAPMRSGTIRRPVTAADERSYRPRNSLRQAYQAAWPSERSSPHRPACKIEDSGFRRLFSLERCDLELPSCCGKVDLHPCWAFIHHCPGICIRHEICLSKLRACSL